ncbi:Extracellular basic protease precursor [Actinomyces bovis]|uniref:Extracellular basic protease n=1 Tax=Actinomyces bovis TaxID=1658 RepID=A0ABY1VRQ2_9ACTO|nr:S8 family peptidase [Actinomyces bovis]SPT55050.1 Extracellular basic protease precursor [Actinomyces bovis]VEG56216.1 Extracellular basic protease precursor [Actinomyces israelii]
MTVAVIDSGILAHPDLEGQVLPSYDFISDPQVSGDNDGRDANPADEGDYYADNQCQQGMRGHASSWHGTHVAGTIAAATNNRTGISGVAPDSKILPVRALGRCGGRSSDIVDAITWSAGGQVYGVPDNPNPAKVINLSLGGARACPAYYQRTIDAAVARGAIVVAAAGNNAEDAKNAAPASCNNVITVGATTNTGQRAIYSNFGSTVEVSAPGGFMDKNTPDGGILSLGDTSETTPQGYTYMYMIGTSQAAPHVSGTVALMTAIDPNLDTTRATQLLQSTSTPMTCDQDSCGTGVINAASAVAELAKQKGVNPAPSPAPAPPVETAPPADPAPSPAPEPTKRSVKERLDDLIRKIKAKKGK